MNAHFSQSLLALSTQMSLTKIHFALVSVGCPSISLFYNPRRSNPNCLKRPKLHNHRQELFRVEESTDTQDVPQLAGFHPVSHQTNSHLPVLHVITHSMDQSQVVAQIRLTDCVALKPLLQQQQQSLITIQIVPLEAPFHDNQAFLTEHDLFKQKPVDRVGEIQSLPNL
jgi:hypothetical protein